MDEKLTHIVDRYLDDHQHSTPAYEHVAQVLAKFEFFIDLATKRAADELTTTATVTYLDDYRAHRPSE